ncbi:PP2C family protein-serine/threonine phosphatase [Streptomyces sp. NPDC059534]|uniref:PP2C family protein-serine/threonine phosphatase n=1 Tax=Streptomyces sp. NPDC059534 TaxID=3346859 RepID=UPI0036AF4E9F
MDNHTRGTPGDPPGEGHAGGVGRLARALPSLCLVMGVVFQLSTPRELTGMPFFAAAPLISAPLFSSLATVLYGGAGLLAITTYYAVTGHMGGVTAAHGLVTELATLVFVTAIAVLLNRVVHRDRNRLASARGVAETAQRAVLPTPEHRVDGLRLGARYEAAQEDTLIGGDLYAARSTPHGVRLLIGDVRGKGLGAIETVSVILGAFWEAADREGCLSGVAGSLERALAREGARRAGIDDTEGFTTCALVEIPPGHEELRVLNLGHPEPLLLHRDGTVAQLTPGSFSLPLGLGELAPGPGEMTTCAFPPESTLLLYTDGLSEARNTADVFYDPVTHLSGRTFATPDRLLDALVADVRRFTAGARSDDMALLAVRRPLSRPGDRTGR